MVSQLFILNHLEVRARFLVKGEPLRTDNYELITISQSFRRMSERKCFF
jgi:hypothetical protein